MTDESPDKVKLNTARIIFSITYFISAVIIVSFWHDKIFYLEVNPNYYNSYRFWWCLACSFFSFSVLAITTIKKQKSPTFSYLTYYPFMLLVISALVFSACHLFERTSGFIFYYISFTFCFILSFLVDSFWVIIFRLIQSKGK